MEKKNNKPQKIKIRGLEFEVPSNGTYRIKFAKKDESDGFAILFYAGGWFHRTPDYYVITARQKELLDKAEISYKIVS